MTDNYEDSPGSRPPKPSSFSRNRDAFTQASLVFMRRLMLAQLNNPGALNAVIDDICADEDLAGSHLWMIASICSGAVPRAPAGTAPAAWSRPAPPRQRSR